MCVNNSIHPGRSQTLPMAGNYPVTFTWFGLGFTCYTPAIILDRFLRSDYLKAAQRVHDELTNPPSCMFGTLTFCWQEHRKQPEKRGKHSTSNLSGLFSMQRLVDVEPLGDLQVICVSPVDSLPPLQWYLCP